MKLWRVQTGPGVILNEHLVASGRRWHAGTHHNSNYFLDVFPQGPWEVKTGLLDHTLTLEGTFASFTVNVE